MNEFKITLQTSQEILAVCKLSPNEEMPSWIKFENNKFISITQTPEELSIVCNQHLVPASIEAVRNWRWIRIKGQLDFSLVGILKRVISPLSENGISIYTISTYDTDYILIKENDFENAIKILSKYFVIEALEYNL